MKKSINSKGTHKFREYQIIKSDFIESCKPDYPRLKIIHEKEKLTKSEIISKVLIYAVIGIAVGVLIFNVIRIYLR